PAMPTSALRYTPLLILALLLIPLRLYMAESLQQNPAFPPNQDSSPFHPGSALYSITILPQGDVWAVGGSFTGKPISQNGTHRSLFPTSGLILHYVANVWAVARVADPRQAPLLGVWLASRRAGWAVGWGASVPDCRASASGT